MKDIRLARRLATAALITCLILLVQSLSAQTAGQSVIQKKNTGAGFTLESFTLSNGQLIGRTSAGTLSGITLGSGLTLTGTTLTASGSSGGTWGSITGTLSSQTDLQTALNLCAPLASPTFTGTVTIPSGASISGYLTTAAAASTYQPLDSDLTALAALTTTAHGRSLLTGANPAATLITLGLSPDDDLAINNIIAGGTVSAALFSGDGGGLSNLSGGSITAASIPNAALANSSITINGSAVSLGGSTTITTGYPLTLTGGTVTASSPLISATQTWNAGAQVFHAHDLNITSTNGSTHAVGSTLQRWMISGSPVLSIASNTTSGNETSNWRLVFGADASLGWSASWGALMVRNAANSAYANLRLQLVMATTGVAATNYVSAGSATGESEAILSSTTWRGAGLRMRNTGTITWTTGTDATSAADIIIDIGTASPEGSITANPGSLYLRNNSGTGEMWLKTSGTGNTGWTLK